MLRRERRRIALKESKSELKRLGIPRRKNKGLLYKNWSFYMIQGNPGEHPIAARLDVREILKKKNKYFERIT